MLPVLFGITFTVVYLDRQLSFNTALRIGVYGFMSLLVGLYLFKTYRKHNQFYLQCAAIIIGAALGVSTAITRSGASVFAESRAYAPGQVIHGEAQVLETSARSVVIHDKENNVRLRITGLASEKFADDLKASYRYDYIRYRCEYFLTSEQESLFNTLEKLRQIQGMCSANEYKVLSDRSHFFKDTRLQIKDFISKKLDNLPGETLAHGILLADTESVKPVEMQLYRDMGIAHLFSASGLHLGILFGIFFLPFYRLNKPVTGSVVGFIAALFFLILLDFRLSLVRAFLFLSIYLFLKLVDRKTHPLYVLFFTAMITELIYPLSFFSVSFILSFGITGFIILFYGFFYQVIILKPVWLRAHLALTLAAFTGSAFLSFLIFENFNIVFFIYNLILVPLTTLYLFSVLTFLFIPVAGYVVQSLDLIFKYSASLHYEISRWVFFNYSEVIILFWLFFLAVLLAAFIYYMSKQRFWLVRKYFLRSVVLLVVVYFLPAIIYIFQKPGPSLLIKPQAADFIWYYPYGAVIKKPEHLFVTGKKADFLTGLNLPQLHGFYVEKFLSSAEHEIEAQFKEYIPPMVELSKAEASIQNGVLHYSGECHVFSNILQPQYFKPDEFSRCKKIYVVQSKKSIQSPEQWQEFLAIFGARNAIKTVPYFKKINTSTLPETGS